MVDPRSKLPAREQAGKSSLARRSLLAYGGGPATAADTVAPTSSLLAHEFSPRTNGENGRKSIPLTSDSALTLT